MVKFFLVVRPWPSYSVAALAAVTALALVTLWLSPGELDSGLGLILFVQMFLASSGFAPRARRGHFDSLLLHGRDRTRVLVAHWLVSVLPGTVSWLLVALCGWWMQSPAAPSALAGERLSALLIVSAVAWSAGFLLPRGVAGALWLGSLVALLIRHVDLLSPAVDPVGSGATLRQAAGIAMCPFLLIGAPRRLAATAVVAAACMSAALLLSTWRLGTRLDIYLVERT